MREYKVWIEGYSATGEYAPAHLVGVVSASSFKEACKKIYEGKDLFDEDKLAYWGCKLYETEAEARRLFG